jgi:uncharacterized membrane protein YkoI
VVRNGLTLKAAIAPALLAVALAAALLATPSTTTAQQPESRLLERRGEISLDEARRIATRRHAGRVISARRNPSGQPAYEIRIVNEGGDVFVVRVDARTGEIL